MRNPKLPEALWVELDGGLWHATDMQGAKGILADRAILVSRSDRYRNSLCRTLGGVCLFDFGSASVDQTEFESSNWYGWLGHAHSSQVVVWLKVDRSVVSSKLLDPLEMLTRAETMKSYKFFFGVETCHIGPISTLALCGALLIDGKNIDRFSKISGLSDLPDALAQFEDRLST